MTRENQKQVNIYLNKWEKEALDKLKGDLTYREWLMRGTVEPRTKGRPSIDAATKDLEDQHRKRDEDNRNQIHDQLLEANRRGLDPEVSIRMLGDASEWNEVVCSNCQNTYFTTSKTQSKCWRCGVLNRTPWKPPVYEIHEEQQVHPKEEEVPDFEEKRLGNLRTGFEDNLVEEEYEGNLTNKTLSERARKYHNINEDDWLALTETEKEYYIALLPPEKPKEGEMNKDNVYYKLDHMFKYDKKG